MPGLRFWPPTSIQLYTWGDHSSVRFTRLCSFLLLPSAAPPVCLAFSLASVPWACGQWGPISFPGFYRNLELLPRACPLSPEPQSHFFPSCPCFYPLPRVLLLPSTHSPATPALQGPLAPPSSPRPGGLSSQCLLGVRPFARSCPPAWGIGPRHCTLSTPTRRPVHRQVLAACLEEGAF